MLPISLYVAVALVIAIVAFVLGQLVPGAGIIFVLFASCVWTINAVKRSGLKNLNR
jgi:hypothetical protein